MVLINPNTNFVYDSRFFTLAYIPQQKSTLLKMQLKISAVNTKYFPLTYSVLKQELPSVLRTKCFNEQNIPFRTEVMRTEIGHLFEHILLEYMCLDKYQCGYKRVVFNGKTKWNWIENPYGSFDIIIDAGLEDKQFFFPALKKSILLTEKILANGVLFEEDVLAYSALMLQINEDSYNGTQKHL